MKLKNKAELLAEQDELLRQLAELADEAEAFADGLSSGEARDCERVHARPYAEAA